MRLISSGREAVLEHSAAKKAERPRFRQIKVLHQDYSSWKINHNKLAAAEDFSLIPATIASISTSKRHKGFLQLSLDASRRLSVNNTQSCRRERERVCGGVGGTSWRMR